MNILGSFNSKVGKKFFTAFCIAGILPLFLIVSSLYTYTRSYLVESSIEALQQESKLFNIITVDKLNTAFEEANAFLENKGQSKLSQRIFIEHSVASMALAMTSSDQDTLSSINIDAKNELVLTLYDESLSSIHEFRINPVFLWGDLDILSDQYTYCLINDKKQIVFCSNNFAPEDQFFKLKNFSTNWVSQSNDSDLLVHNRTFSSGHKLKSSGWRIFATAEKETVLRQTEYFKHFFGLALIFTLLLIGLLSRRLIQKILSPLNALKIASEQISQSGHSETIEAERTQDEFEDVIDSFNKMTENLDVQFKNLSYLSELDKKIIDNLDIDSMLCLVNEALFDCLQSRFIACGLRTPGQDKMRICIQHGVNQQTSSRFITADKIPNLLLDSTTGEEHIVLSPSHLDQFSPEFIETVPDYSDEKICYFPMADNGETIGFILLLGAKEYASNSKESKIINGYKKRLRLGKSHGESLDQLNKHANFDFLTGLPNRKQLVEHLRYQLNDDQADKAFLVLYIDLDNFKQINDSLGHHLGDELLIEVGKRLSEKILRPDIVARQGGDEFIVVKAIKGGKEESETTSQMILESFAEPILLAGHHINVSLSLGMAIYPDDGNDMETLLMNADTALYNAKRLGKSQYLRYDSSMNASALKRLELENDLWLSISKKQLKFHYQPIVDFKTKTLGFEALIRWEHPVKGRRSPVEFIPVAEETGFINEIHQWMFNEIFQDTFELKQKLGKLFSKVSINLSAVQLSIPDFVDTVENALTTHNLSARDIEFELTESVYFENFTNSSRTLAKLNALGFKLALDDFGTGYSSLSYIQRLPFDRLKIDQSFVQEIEDDKSITPILSTILDMAKNLNMDVTAEGVETRHQLNMIQANSNCAIQGYLFSKPMARDECIHFASKHIFD